jgi:hypothetical protein
MPKTVNIQTPNDRVIFNTRISDIDELIVRTGTISDGSCLIHAILQATSSDYRNMTNTERSSYVKRLRRQISSSITREEWANLSDGTIAMVAFQEKVLETINILYKYFQTGKSKNMSKTSDNVIFALTKTHTKEQIIDIYKIIIEIVSINVFEKHIIPRAHKSVIKNKGKIDEYQDEIIKQLKLFMDQSKVFSELERRKSDKIKKLLIRLVNEILFASESEVYNLYKKDVQTSSEYIDLSSINLYSDYFNRDIYFLDANTRLPYNVMYSSENIKNRTSIILLWINECHFELIGRIHRNSTKIQNEFSPNDGLIKKIKNYLSNPKKFIKELDAFDYKECSSDESSTDSE